MQHVQQTIFLLQPRLALVWLAFIFGCGLSFVATASAQALPELPILKVETFEPGIRAQLGQAYREAQARPREAATNGKLGMALHAYSQYEFAAHCYARARNFNPQEFRWHYYYGLVRSALGQHIEAIAAFKTALQLQPEDLPTRLRLAEAHLAAGQLQASQSLYEALGKQQSTRAQSFYGLGQINFARGEQAQSIAYFRQALALFPEYGIVHFTLGQALRDQGQTAEAKEHLALSQRYKYQQPVLEDPLLAAIAELNASATDLLTRGVALDAMGKLEPAIAAHERALEINPKLTQAHINLISLYARAGQFEQAEKHYRAALADNPNLADSYFNYGIVLLGRDRLTEAAAAFQQSLERNPFNAEAHYNYAIIIEREGRLEEAATHYQKALENNPQHRQAHFHWARILVQQENWPAALDHLRQTLTPEDDETARFTYALGATHIRAGERHKGIPYLQAALKLAIKYGQTELGAIIERDLKQLEQER